MTSSRQWLDERTVDGGERVGVAVNALGMPMLGRHPEVALNGLGDAVGELVMEDRPVTTQFGEQIIGKTVPPQRENRTDRLESVVGMRRPRFAGLDLECLK